MTSYKVVGKHPVYNTAPGGCLELDASARNTTWLLRVGHVEACLNCDCKVEDGRSEEDAETQCAVPCEPDGCAECPALESELEESESEEDDPEEGESDDEDDASEEVDEEPGTAGRWSW